MTFLLLLLKKREELQVQIPWTKAAVFLKSVFKSTE